MSIFSKYKVIYQRLYYDYLMPSRLDEYEALIVNILDEGYEIISVVDYFRRLKNGAVYNNDKLFINRHDIDTDVKTARRIFNIEKSYNVNASYYFRLKTLDFLFMQEINNYGSEASYHFEELASFSKCNNLTSKYKVLEHIGDIRSEFKKNFLKIERELGFKLKSVASHGDFANRKLGVTNHPITNCEKLREELGIEVEVYDDELFSSFDVYLSDRLPPLKFEPMTPISAINKEYRVIYMLTHPRQWYASWTSNTIENLSRLIEGWKWG